MKTYSAKKEDIERAWFIVDATDQTLGRMATQIATILRGKHKPLFTPHVDCGDFVVVVNAEKLHVTGNRMDEKKYYRHSGYTGNLRTTTLREAMQDKPDFVVREAVRRMLPKNSLGRQMLKKLKVYAGPDHPHEAQQPQPLEIQR